MCPSIKSTVVTKESGANSKVKWSPTQVSLGSSLMGSINRKNKTNTHLLFFPKQYNGSISHRQKSEEVCG